MKTEKKDVKSAEKYYVPAENKWLTKEEIEKLNLIVIKKENGTDK